MIIKPIKPPYDPLLWKQLPFPEKAKQVCEAWALQGYGSPLLIYLVYLLKIGLYIAGWIFFCSFTPGMGSWASWDWIFHPIAFQKAIVWSMLFEVLGLGCGSGPLTGRYLPPVGGFLYFLRPGTIKLPLFKNMPLLGSDSRGLLDIVLYAGLLVMLSMALIQATPDTKVFLAIVLCLGLLGMLDKTVFLAARAEHYWITIILFACTPNWIVGAMLVQLALWFFAGVSKLNRHFATVVCVMTSNGPLTPWNWFRKKMYRDFPDDLRPSRLAELKTIMGTVLELSIPIVFMIGMLNGSRSILMDGLVLMVLLHVYITSNVPMGVPLEWNVLVVYGGFFFFFAHPDLHPMQLDSWPLVLLIFVSSFLIPVIGNFKPAWISFLFSMRYYAGNWATSVWLFKGDAMRKLDQLTKSSPLVQDQLEKLYDRSLSIGILSKVIAFRLMHLHGRAHRLLLPRLVDFDRLHEYEWLDGELVAGLALGWNFGDGHLHNEDLLLSIQKRCNFEPGELRCIFLESQPLGGKSQAYRLWDAADGQLESGQVPISAMLQLQPWG